MCTKSMKLNKNCAGAMATVKNEVFIGLLHGNFYLMGTELAFGGRRNCSRCEVNEKTLASGRITPYLPVGKTLLIYRIYII